jgi:peptidoglycan/LPS O-acetylase OafA/YrhL
VAVGLVLVILGALFWASTSYHYDGQNNIVSTAVFVAIGGAIALSLGRRAGRTVMAVALAISGVFTVPYCLLVVTGTDLYDTMYGLVDLGATACVISALVLFYKPVVTNHLNARVAARDGRKAKR